MPISASRPVLWHLAMSHYNEKARWALDYKQVPHTRRAVMPGFHVLVAKRLGGGDTMPVMTIGDDVYTDSTDIIAALEKLRPDPPLYPTEPEERARALELEDEFDRVLAPALRALLYQHVLPDPAAAAAFLAHGGPPTREALLRPLMPALGAAIRQTHAVPPFGDPAPLETVIRYVDLLGELTAGREFLVGDEFSVADLAACAILAPALAADAIPGPPYPKLPSALLELFEPLAARPGGVWASRTYRVHRPGTRDRTLTAA